MDVRKITELQQYDEVDIKIFLQTMLNFRTVWMKYTYYILFGIVQIATARYLPQYKVRTISNDPFVQKTGLRALSTLTMSISFPGRGSDKLHYQRKEKICSQEERSCRCYSRVSLANVTVLAYKRGLRLSIALILMRIFRLLQILVTQRYTLTPMFCLK